MIGAIGGDIIGSVYEFGGIKSKSFPLFHEFCDFTDDTVLTVAVADAILSGRPYGDAVLEFERRHPGAGYGGAFKRWFRSPDPRPYGSWGNGSAMRVSPVGFAFDTEEEVMRQARLSAEITHDHPEGVKGAQAAAVAVFHARSARSKAFIRARIEDLFEYDLGRTLDAIRPDYRFDVSCQGSVPEAIIAFLESDSYEDAVRNAVSLGGDADTLACITGGIAEAFYGGVPDEVRLMVSRTLTNDLAEVVNAFVARYL